ncbi:MAG: DUF115 domain-containing protein [Spirochaetes bacterium]|nr:DUF115 domain-containing protein [Spirochaetota bacterium]
MVDKDQLYRNLNEGILAERLGAFRRNLGKNLPLIRRYGGLKRIVPCLEGRTAVVIGAGPSLEKHYAALKKLQYRDEMVYIAADMALGPLVKSGIRPRFVISCETSPVDFFGGIDTARMHLIAFSCMSHANLMRWRGDISFYNWLIDDASYRELWETAGLELGSVATGSLVTTQAVAFALGCGISGLVMAGNDLGFSDRFYARGAVACRALLAGSSRLETSETREMARSRRAMEYRIRRGERDFFTTRQFLAAKMWLEDLFRGGRSPVYDCSVPGCSEKYVIKTELSAFFSAIDGGKKKKRRKK